MNLLLDTQIAIWFAASSPKLPRAALDAMERAHALYLSAASIWKMALKSRELKIDLARLATRRPNEISVGESQRVAVARALANGPKALLADEPTASLDAKGTAAVLEAFALAQTSYHASIVLASHDPGVRAVPAATYRLESGILSRDR